MKIGVFDSGYGGLTILSKIRHHLPQYDYLYLGDNARAPYGERSFECIYQYTLQAVRYLHQQGCRLIILACNTASAKALRTIQQHDIDSSQLRVLGVIRPTVEVVPSVTRNGHIGILATPATVSSESYLLELAKISNLQSLISNQLVVKQQSCPMWVPLIEAGEHLGEGADFFVHEYISALLAQDPQIDTILLGCTHYPLLISKIEAELAGQPIRIVAQGEIVAKSLEDYLRRHTEIETLLTKNGTCVYQTTESESKFQTNASLFLSETITPQHVEL